VICGFASGKLVALDLISGEILWETSITVPGGRTELERMVDIDGDPLVQDGVVYATTYQGDMAAVGEGTGVVLWRRKLSAYTTIGADWRQLYVADEDGVVWAVDPRNGSAVWKNEKLRGRRLSAPSVLGDYVLVGDYQGYLHWLAPEDGRIIARNRVGSDPISEPPLVFDDVAYVYGDGGRLAAISLNPSEGNGGSTEGGREDSPDPLGLSPKPWEVVLPESGDDDSLLPGLEGR
jgi:outer membrane protein assembly factor BamB